jgi:hypothetical protein
MGDVAMDVAEKQLERITALRILAAEDWAKIYSKDPENKAKLIRAEIKLRSALLRYFKDLSQRTHTFINWYAYTSHLQNLKAAANTDDFTVDVIVNQVLDNENSIIMQVIFEPLLAATALGAISGQSTYGIDLGLTDSSSLIQKAAKQRVADLVGMQLTQDGVIIKNPNAKYHISDKTREDIRHSISTSLSLGENQQQATERLQKTIKNPKRAATIARTEAINSYQKGLMSFGKESGAIGKEWQTVGAIDICAQYAALGIVDFGYKYDAGITEPAAHPNCRCGLRLVYPEEFESQ